MQSGTRRAVIGGMTSALAPLDGARAAPLAYFVLHIFIPAPAVAYAGRIFGGGDKVMVQGAIDLEVTGPGALRVSRLSFGTTREYADTAVEAASGRPAWYRTLRAGAKPLAEATQSVSDQTLSVVWAVPAGGTHGCSILVEGRNPLVTGAPAIDAVFILGFRLRNGRLERRLDCKHDGFPSYELHINGRLVRDYDGLTDTPLGLFPPMERTYATGWMVV